MVKILVKFILPIILTVMGFLFKKYFKVFNKEAMKFKTIRTEYLKDKTMGYFYLQSYLKIRLSKKEMDFILNSSDAYSIMKKIKNAYGDYVFDGKKFKGKINGRAYIMPVIGYFISALGIMFYITFYREILNFGFDKISYFWTFIIIISVFGPILFSSVLRLREIGAIFYLEKITSKKWDRSNEKNRLIIRTY